MAPRNQGKVERKPFHIVATDDSFPNYKKGETISKPEDTADWLRNLLHDVVAKEGTRYTVEDDDLNKRGAAVYATLKDEGADANAAEAAYIEALTTAVEQNEFEVYEEPDVSAGEITAEEAELGESLSDETNALLEDVADTNERDRAGPLRIERALVADLCKIDKDKDEYVNDPIVDWIVPGTRYDEPPFNQEGYNGPDPDYYDGGQHYRNVVRSTGMGKHNLSMARLVEKAGNDGVVLTAEEIATLCKECKLEPFKNDTNPFRADKNMVKTWKQRFNGRVTTATTKFRRAVLFHQQARAIDALPGVNWGWVTSEDDALVQPQPLELITVQRQAGRGGGKKEGGVSRPLSLTTFIGLDVDKAKAATNGKVTVTALMNTVGKGAKAEPTTTTTTAQLTIVPIRGATQFVDYVNELAAYVNVMTEPGSLGKERRQAIATALANAKKNEGLILNMGDFYRAMSADVWPLIENEYKRLEEERTKAEEAERDQRRKQGAAN